MKDYEYEKYSNGNIKMKAEIVDNVRCGELLEYYKDGSLRSKQEWKDGVMDGIFAYYYRSGKLQGEGVASNGNIVYVTKYYESGYKSQVEEYDSLGTVLDIQKYYEDGKRDTVGFAIFFILGGDTVVINDEIIFKAKMVNVTDPLYENGKLYITTGFDTLNNEINEPLDTLKIITPLNHLEYEYSFKAKGYGEQFIFGQIVFTMEKGDDLIVVSQKFAYSYYVVSKVRELPPARLKKLNRHPFS